MGGRRVEKEKKKDEQEAREGEKSRKTIKVGLTRQKGRDSV